MPPRASKISREVEPGALVAASEVLPLLVQALEETPVRQGRFERDGLALLAPVSARGLAFDVVLVPGLVEQSFPRVGRPDPLLFDAERAELSRLTKRPLPPRTGRRHAREERFLFHLARSSARHRLVLLAARREAATDRPRLLSPFLLDFLEERAGHPVSEGDLAGPALADRLSVRWIRLGRPATAEPPVDGEEALRRALALSPKLASALPPGLEPLERALRRGRARAEERYTEYEGRLSRAPLRLLFGDRPLSPSRLERLASCAYRAFLMDALGLSAPEEPPDELVLDGKTVGELAHAALEVLAVEAMRSGSSLADVLRSRADAEARAAGPLVPRRLGDRPPARPRRSGHHPARGPPPRRRRARGDNERTRFLSPGPRFASALPRVSKHAAGEGLARVSLTGRIDRLDRDGAEARVVDYKFSRPSPFGVTNKKGYRIAGGEKVQLAAYALAARALGASSVSSEYLFAYPEKAGASPGPSPSPSTPLPPRRPSSPSATRSDFSTRRSGPGTSSRARSRSRRERASVPSVTSQPSAAPGTGGSTTPSARARGSPTPAPPSSHWRRSLEAARRRRGAGHRRHRRREVAPRGGLGGDRKDEDPHRPDPPARPRGRRAALLDRRDDLHREGRRRDEGTPPEADRRGGAGHPGPGAPGARRARATGPRQRRGLDDPLLLLAPPPREAGRGSRRPRLRDPRGRGRAGALRGGLLGLDRRGGARERPGHRRPPPRPLPGNPSRARRDAPRGANARRLLPDPRRPASVRTDGAPGPRPRRRTTRRRGTVRFPRRPEGPPPPVGPRRSPVPAPPRPRGARGLRARHEDRLPPRQEGLLRGRSQGGRERFSRRVEGARGPPPLPPRREAPRGRGRFRAGRLPAAPGGREGEARPPRLRRPAPRGARPPPPLPRGARALPGAFPPPRRRRVPGHRPRPGRDRPPPRRAAGRAGPRTLGRPRARGGGALPRRRPEAVDLPLPQGRRRDLPPRRRRARCQRPALPRHELPLRAPHPRLRERRLRHGLRRRTRRAVGGRERAPRAAPEIRRRRGARAGPLPRDAGPPGAKRRGGARGGRKRRRGGRRRGRKGHDPGSACRGEPPPLALLGRRLPGHSGPPRLE